MRVLVLDDSEADRVLAVREVRKGFPHAEFIEAGDPEAFEAALSGPPFDVVVTDFQMGWTNGLEVLGQIKRTRPDVPVLMLTSSGNERIAVQAMKDGASDYILKDQLGFDRLPRAVAAALELARQRGELVRAERRYGDLFRSVSVGLARCAPEGTIREVNPALAAMLGRGLDEVPGLSLPSLLRDMEHPWQELLSGDAQQVRLERPDGALAWVVLQATAVECGDVECALTDVTQAKRAAEEREALLGELYHRVNNTLQMLIGMVHTQMTRSSDPAIRQMLLDLAGRMHAISLVQQRLYAAERFTHVELDQFLQDLAASVTGITAPSLRLELAPVSLQVGQAIPIGLAANELLANCVKHAFKGERRGEISIRLTRETEVAVLEIGDDGVGLPPQAERRDGYGTRLLSLLTRQAGAQMEMSSEPGRGTRATLRIPIGRAE